mmetsp:Transcript_109731/g.310426  ORF Transcript_109731/g.310426 Transcript_109731/m.310426 type:complete len:455 (+) Transcript_109731:272-1636(+)
MVAGRSSVDRGASIISFSNSEKECTLCLMVLRFSAFLSFSLCFMDFASLLRGFTGGMRKSMPRCSFGMTITDPSGLLYSTLFFSSGRSSSLGRMLLQNCRVCSKSTTSAKWGGSCAAVTAAAASSSSSSESSGASSLAWRFSVSSSFFFSRASSALSTRPWRSRCRRSSSSRRACNRSSLSRVLAALSELFSTRACHALCLRSSLWCSSSTAERSWSFSLMIAFMPSMWAWYRCAMDFFSSRRMRSCSLISSTFCLRLSLLSPPLAAEAAMRVNWETWGFLLLSMAISDRSLFSSASDSLWLHIWLSRAAMRSSIWSSVAKPSELLSSLSCCIVSSFSRCFLATPSTRSSFLCWSSSMASSSLSRSARSSSFLWRNSSVCGSERAPAGADDAESAHFSSLTSALVCSTAAASSPGSGLVGSTGCSGLRLCGCSARSGLRLPVSLTSLPHMVLET